MLRLLVFAFILSLWSSAASSQAKFTVGDAYDVVDATSKFYFTENGEIMTVKVDKRGVVIQKMNTASLTLLKKQVYEDFPEGFFLEDVVTLANRYYLFYSIYAGNQEQLFVRELDFALGSCKGAAKKVISEERKIFNVTARGIRPAEHKYNFYLSYDKNTVLIQYRLDPESKRDNYDVIGLHVFDQTMNKKWEKKLTMEYTEALMDNVDYAVDAAGNAYLALRIYQDENNDAHNTIEIVKVAAGTGKVKSSNVAIAGKYIQRFRIQETAQGYVVGVGYYNAGDDKDHILGAVTFRVNESGGVTNVTTCKIPLSVINTFVSPKDQKKLEDGDVPLVKIVLKDVHVQDDGSVIFVGEQDYMVSGSTVLYFLYGNIYVTKLDAAGEMVWIKKLPKYQIGYAGKSALSYRYLTDADNHYFLFLDNDRNLNLSKDEYPARHEDGKGGFLTCYTLDNKTGSEKKNTILDIANMRGTRLDQFKPGNVLLGSTPNTFLFEAYLKKDRDALIKVVLE